MHFSNNTATGHHPTRPKGQKNRRSRMRSCGSAEESGSLRQLVSWNRHKLCTKMYSLFNSNCSYLIWLNCYYLILKVILREHSDGARQLRTSLPSKRRRTNREKRKDLTNLETAVKVRTYQKHIWCGTHLSAAETKQKKGFRVRSWKTKTVCYVTYLDEGSSWEVEPMKKKKTSR